MLKIFSSLLFVTFLSNFTASDCYAINHPADTSDTNKYAEIRNLVQAWNEAINKSQADKLKELYAEHNVAYYLTRITGSACVEKKIAWLNKNKEYLQTIGEIEIFPIDIHGIPTICNKFRKEYSNKGKMASVISLLYFQKWNNQWKIVKETDETSENKRIQSGTLKKEQYTFSNYYSGEDGQEGEVEFFSHILHVNIGEQITGNYHFSSSLSHSTFSWTITEGKMENGFLYLTMRQEEGPYTEVDEDHPIDFIYIFEVINQKELIDIEDQLPPLLLEIKKK